MGMGITPGRNAACIQQCINGNFTHFERFISKRNKLQLHIHLYTHLQTGQKSIKKKSTQPGQKTTLAKAQPINKTD